MRSLVLSLILGLAVLGTLAAPPVAEAHPWVGGYYPGSYGGWRGGSHYQWRGGSHYGYLGNYGYLGLGGYGGYSGSYLDYGGYGGYSTSYLGYGGYGGYSGSYLGYGGYGGYLGGYGYYQPSIGISLTSYPSSLYDYSPALVSFSAPRAYAAPSVSTTIVTTPSAASDPASIEGATYVEPARSDRRCHLEVRVPYSTAQVYFNGVATQQTGLSRQFASPPLTPGKTYNYTIEARWMEKGQVVDQTRTVAVSASQATVVDFAEPENLPAPESVPAPTAPR